MQAVWDRVDLGNNQNYAPGVDIIGFYSQLRRFMCGAAKPIFGVAGNHDAYLDAFGISPRAKLAGRTNAGIAADLNLTLYEAVLMFGPTFDDFVANVNPISSFTAEWMEWFYTVFTPFGEASIQLPCQRVVCLGWGNQETMIGGGAEHQARGHLPRADDSVTDVQLKLLKNACMTSETHKVVLLTHFTVASFHEKTPMVHRAADGTKTAATDVLRTYEPTFDDANMGTFEKGQMDFYKLLDQRTITCMLTGHSHRRGLYFWEGMQPNTGGYTVSIHDPERFKLEERPKDKLRPAIVVSDSAGPYPRHNYAGELGGYGSDLPSGSVVHFDDEGELQAVRVVRAKSAKPRLAVSVDYLDLEDNAVWREPLQTRLFSISAEAEWIRKGFATDFRYELEVPLHEGLRKLGVNVEMIDFYVEGVSSPRLRIEVDEGGVVALDRSASENLYKWKVGGKARPTFLAITLGFEPNVDEDVGRRYAIDPWIFEVTSVLGSQRGGRGRYCFERPSRSTDVSWYPATLNLATWPDLPDFEKRKQAENDRIANGTQEP